ncbi:sodium/glutamate symporter [Spirochaeta isovalerica]|uniref:ESS family glutamate:Na+ symporter n=1 Tax=Spirochaeta isovalerica TaxID=150 RepID=A0A841RE28_9SPIO|nr:sodium/glutamate symporter [Spirochaeta isovalerica]MBB6481876.1 ESS family glutamate:Na+ symporter [Spirochaeta isovalerica]
MNYIGVDMIFSWTFFIDIGIISLALLTATWLRSKIVFFQKFLIPNSIIAGFLLLPLYNFVLPGLGISSMGLGELAYHMLSISFIAITLRTNKWKNRKRGKNIYATSVVIISQMILQVIIGIGVTLVFIYTVRPELFHSFGYLLPLGFAQGPGQAYAIGESWKNFGIQDAGSIGLTFAAIGFIFCSIGGIYLINYGVKKGWITQEQLDQLKKDRSRTGIYKTESEKPVGAYLSTQSEAIDSMTLHVGLVFFTYLFTFLMLKLIGFLLSFAGPLGMELAENFWGISFVFAALSGIIVKNLLKLLKLQYIVDNHSMHRISGVSIDVMVTSAIAAISLVIVMNYWFPILVAVLLGGAVTIITTPWMCSRMFTDYPFIRMILLFGVSTGTLSTGLALLRVVDPDFETPVAEDYSYASGLTFFMFIPFILTINFPSKAFQTGDPKWMYMSFAVIAAYVLFMLVSIFLISGRKLLKGKRTMWNTLLIQK